MKYLRVVLFSIVACFEPHFIYGELDLVPSSEATPLATFDPYAFLYYVGSSLHMIILICYLHILAIQ